MNTVDYRKLARKCEKHIKGLAIAIDGVVKAEAAGQESMVRLSIRSAQECLSKVLDCVRPTENQPLLAPLHRMEQVLAEHKDGERLSGIEQYLQEFHAHLEFNSHELDTSSKQMVYSGNTLG